MKYIYTLLLTLSVFAAKAQTNLYWDFTTATPTTGLPISNVTVASLASGNSNGASTLLSTTSASTGYAGSSGTSNAGVAAGTGTLNTASGGSAYFEVVFTPASGSTVNISTVNFGTRATSTGPQAYSIRTSLDGYTSNVASGTIANNSTWNLFNNSTTIVGTPSSAITLRIYGHNGAGSPAAGTTNWRIDDLTINVLITSTADITPPTATAFTPADNAINVPNSTNLSVVFSEPIQKGTGNIILKRLSDNSIVQTIDVTTAAVTVNTNTATIAINPLLLSTSYYVEIAPTCIKDNANNFYIGISGNTAWDFSTGASLLNADFTTCSSSLASGFTAFSVTGPQVWACTTFGYAGTPTGSAANGVQINGFASGSNVINEDWLISPSLNLVSTAFPLLSFYSRTAFNGAPLKLRVSTNYTGTGNPNLATWTEINGGFPLQATDVWKLSQNINLTAFKTASTYFAFVYNATDDDGARWTLDNIKVDNSLVTPPPTLTPSTGEVNFAFVASGSNAVKTITFIATDILGPVTLNATGNFLISKTNGSFTSSISFTQAEANNLSKSVFIQFAPTAPTVSYQGNLTISTATLTDTTITMKGNSIDAATTLDVVNWNLEWFGSTTLGPTNDNLQEQNVKTVLQNIAADVYAVEEVVSEPRLASVVNQMPGYSYVLCNYGSRSNPFSTGASPLSESQKQGLIYKTVMFPGGLTSQALLSNGPNTAADLTNPAYNWYASGRYPFMVTGTTTLNGVTKTIRFVIVHAKANTSPTLTSYARRKAGNDSLLIHLNTFYPNDNIIFLGDFNDDLDSTITAGINPKLSSYKQFTDDNTRFFSPTLALSLSGKKSTVSYNDVIDHVMLSNEMQCSYLAGSAAILTDITSLIPNFGNTTTDHYPVFTRYLFSQPSTATISYSGSPFCSNASNVSPTFSGFSGGVFSSTVGLSINAVTGIINIAASTPGSYVITYAIAASGCASAFSTTTNILITAAPNATINYTSTPYCNVAGTATVTRTGNAGGIYSSTNGLVINATSGDINTLTSTPGTYLVTYTVAASSGCAIYTTTATVTINSLSTAPTSATSSATIICASSSTITLTAIGGTLGAGASYRWYSSSCGGTLVGTGTVLTNLPITTTTTYFVRIEGTCNNTTCASVTVTLAAQPIITTAINPTIGFTPNAPVVITATVIPTDNYTYSWTKNNATIITTPANTNAITVYANDAGNYKVTATTALGCSAVSQNIFTPSLSNNTLFIFPNPTSGLFYVAFNNGVANLNGRTLNAYDSKGARVFTKTYSLNVPFENMKVDLRNNAKGIYYLELLDGADKKIASGNVSVL